MAVRTPIVGALMAFAGRLRFPTLFFVFAVLFAIDLLVPDGIPFADEILLGLGTLVLARWRRPDASGGPPRGPAGPGADRTGR